MAGTGPAIAQIMRPVRGYFIPVFFVAASTNSLV